jgi:hypothetical protein
MRPSPCQKFNYMNFNDLKLKYEIFNSGIRMKIPDNGKIKGQNRLQQPDFFRQETAPAACAYPPLLLP